jgi:excisionase family DNA binding protein
MKFAMEPQDIEAMAEKVSEKLKALLSRIKGHGDEDTILDVEGLAVYLRVDTSWVYKQVSLKTIPFFKIGKYTRFRKKDIDKWIEDGTARPVPNLRPVKCGTKN